MLAEPPIVIGLNAVIVAVTKESPRILTISGSLGSKIEGDELRPQTSLDVLPYGPHDSEADRTLELSLRRWRANRVRRVAVALD